MSENHEIERLREKAQHDEAQALYHTEQQGIQKGVSERNTEIARNALQMGMAIDDIVKLTGLAHDEIGRLKI